ncbi:Uncharacterised protein [Mycobacteroides abscessus subsp. abscessus]|nr:Uncharacterised protein [Mycobacteroides abscessus subsp. abscessus]
MAGQRTPGSSCAKASSCSPPATAGRICARWASVPRAATRVPGTTTASSSGSGASLRPISSSTTSVSTAVAPAPPNSSAKPRPSTPSSASWRHTSRLQPSSVSVTFSRVSGS